MPFMNVSRHWREEMRIKGWLLDVRLRDDEAVLWVKTDGERHEYRGSYVPDMFVLPDKVSFEEFMELFDEHPHISAMERVTRYVSIGDTVRSSIIRVKVDSVEQFRTVEGLVRKYGEVFDSDLSHTQRFIADYGLIPFAEVELDLDKAGKISSISSMPLDLKVRPPPFKVICFELISEENRLTITTLDEGMRKEYCFNGSESETLISFLEFIEDTDPDLISSLESDIKTLFKLCLKHNKPSLGVYRRNRFHLEKGRVFISLHIYRRTSLAGIVERIMYAREVPRVGSEYAAGRAIESRQSYEARRLGYLLPRRGFYQPVISLEELLRERDHGGLIFAPTVGLHENVAALDFESMFPHLILKENISYENVRTERESEGFLHDFTKDTLQRRLYFKHHRKELLNQPNMWFWCETRQQALKEILFCT